MLGLLWWISYVTVVAGLTLYGLHRYVMIWLYWKHRKHHPRPLSHFDSLPVVTIQLPVYNERYVVERVIHAAAHLEYPRDRLQIQVLDDSTDDTAEIAARLVADYAAQGLDIVHHRRTNRNGFKAGALEAGMAVARGELIAVFDADFVPSPSFLQETVQYFTDPKVGMIQTRWEHLNRGESLLTRVQGLFLDGHLLIEQTARNRSGRFLNFNGTAGIWRTRCIADAGGWQHDTLTEDLDLSYRAQMKGWQFYFLPHVITPAELPADMNAFKSQQHRWAKGSVQTCKKLLPAILHSDLPLKIKAEAFFHLTANFAYLLLAFMCVLLHPSLKMTQYTWQNVLWIDLPIFASASLSVAFFYLTAIFELSPRWWRDICYIPALIALGIGLSLNNGKAVLEALFNHASEFVRTPKYGEGRVQKVRPHAKYRALRSILPALEVGLAAYYCYFFLFAVQYRLWVSMPFLALFLFGFLYVASLSLLPQRWVFSRGSQ
jgi:cellulose synthase/poly-beta-1,6-N-acetylglucosamine synthase-like glycosyltransferase